ncbi:MAG TPA: hypothetical protein VGQ72_08415 [Pyrinomonadaceae bacterium]|jgi:hypothetical protein|nr:hypothetical protein [Pyrinomonadaceae bacterium]
MNAYFVFAALIAFILGIVHSYLGEKYLIRPILRSEHLMSALSGSVSLKKVALRVCWHFATVAMWGAATTLVFLSSMPFSPTSLIVARIVSLTFAAYTMLVFLTPGLRLIHLRRHLAWAAFLAIAVLSWLGTLR